MKLKFALSLAGFVVITAGCAANALANTHNITSSYFSSINPRGHVVNQPNQKPPQTDITITDANGATIHAIVPNTPINDVLNTYRPYDVDHIYNQYYVDQTEIVLTNVNGHVFFDQTVWRKAVINVSYFNGHLIATQIAAPGA